jgi:large repetitive protein
MDKMDKFIMSFQFLAQIHTLGHSPTGVDIISGQGTSVITTNYLCTAPASGVITVTASNSCPGITSSTGLSFTTTNALAEPAIIAGPTTIPMGTKAVEYSVSTVSGADSYSWSVPSGCSIVSGQGTNSIIVDFSCTAISGNITVNASNTCETTPDKILAITVSGTLANPGVITGTTQPMIGSAVNYSIVPIFGAETYNWTAPAGASPISGQGTNSVWYSFECGAVAGNISVSVENTCIAAGTQATLAITPATATNIGTLR